jgi:hypothetical protein
MSTFRVIKIFVFFGIGFCFLTAFATQALAEEIDFSYRKDPVQTWKVYYSCYFPSCVKGSSIRKSGWNEIGEAKDRSFYQDKCVKDAGTARRTCMIQNAVSTATKICRTVRTGACVGCPTAPAVDLVECQVEPTKKVGDLCYCANPGGPTAGGVMYPGKVVVKAQ